jgi:hypothetical protein
VSDQEQPPPRAIFRYYDGCAFRWGDPLAINRMLIQACGGDPNVLLQASKVRKDGSNVAEAAEAAQHFSGAVRQAFQMVPFIPETGEGATESDCDQAFIDYSAFLEKKNPNSARMPTSPPSTEGYDVATSPPIPGWDSGPTSNASEP